MTTQTNSLQCPPPVCPPPKPQLLPWILLAIVALISVVVVGFVAYSRIGPAEAGVCTEVTPTCPPPPHLRDETIGEYMERCTYRHTMQYCTDAWELVRPRHW